MKLILKSHLEFLMFEASNIFPKVVNEGTRYHAALVLYGGELVLIRKMQLFNRVGPDEVFGVLRTKLFGCEHVNCRTGILGSEKCPIQFQ